MKKILLGLAIALTSFAAFAVTYIPLSLFNPAGSTAGQVPLSTGPTTAPAWGNVSISTLTGIVPIAKGGTNASTASGTALDNITGFAGTGFMVRAGGGTYSFLSTTNGIGLGNLAQVAANTVLGNATGSTANLTAFVMPSCSTSASAINWTSGAGWTCNAAVNAATLGGATFASPPVAGYGSATPEPVAATTISATGLISPSSTVGIKATATNDSAQAGSIGEAPAPTNLTSVALTTATPANVASISLAAGDWLVFGVVQFVPAGTTAIQSETAGISTTSATFGGLGSLYNTPISYAAGGGNITPPPTPTVHIKLASAGTVYLVAQAFFTVSTCAANGFIVAIRPR